jgi:8-oxo-dGTP diphosphatase
LRSPSPITLAGSVILDPAGRVLLLHRCVPGREQWETPGGKVEDGESAEEAARRETREELGVEVRLVRPLGTASFHEGASEWHYHWFLAEVVSGAPALQEPQKHDQLRFFSWEQLREMESQLSANTRNLLAAALAGRFDPPAPAAAPPAGPYRRPS